MNKKAAGIGAVALLAVLGFFGLESIQRGYEKKIRPPKTRLSVDQSTLKVTPEVSREIPSILSEDGSARIVAIKTWQGVLSFWRISDHESPRMMDPFMVKTIMLSSQQDSLREQAKKDDRWFKIGEISTLEILEALGIPQAAKGHDLNRYNGRQVHDGSQVYIGSGRYRDGLSSGHAALRVGDDVSILQEIAEKGAKTR